MPAVPTQYLGWGGKMVGRHYPLYAAARQLSRLQNESDCLFARLQNESDCLLTRSAHLFAIVHDMWHWCHLNTANTKNKLHDYDKQLSNVSWVSPCISSYNTIQFSHLHKMVKECGLSKVACRNFVPAPWFWPYPFLPLSCLLILFFLNFFTTRG